MPELNQWWTKLPKERYWLEITRRPDIGTNLKTPQKNENGTEFWSYSLITKVRPGDIVYHYHGIAQAITARSTAVGSTWEDDILWAARGTSAREARIAPHVRKGWYLGLERFEILHKPVTLNAIRDASKQVKANLAALEAQVGNRLYFPFEIGDKRPIRPMQGYLFKLPKFFVDQFELSRTVPRLELAPPDTGVAYRSADEDMSLPDRDAFSVDPAIVERGIRGHARTQNLLAKHLLTIGLTPLSPSASDPDYDLAWCTSGMTFIAEVKSITTSNEEKQLRLALGQVLRYTYQLGQSLNLRAVIVIERPPADPGWRELCNQMKVILTWPEDFRESITV